jgi:alkylation response protein AidB-like acyl-CoA dehydrogenase
MSDTTSGNQAGKTPDLALAPPQRSILDEALLARIGSRAAGYDRDNRFFQEDLVELRDAGFLQLAVPTELGGLGLTLPDYVREVARLAYHAPSTALALNMHVYWTGTANHLWRLGDKSAQWILDEALAGRIFAAGHGEPGNDVGLDYSFVDAEPLPDGGYRFTGRKVFTSLSPVWDWLGVHGLDKTDPAQPKVVHAFIQRETRGVRTVETWDTLGVRATRSDDTLLEGAIAPREFVARVLPAGPPADPFIDGIFGWAISGISSVYYGIAKRAFDLAAAGAQRRSSVALGGKTYAHHPLTQSSIAEAAVKLDAIQALVERVANDWWAGVDHGSRWPAKILAAKLFAADTAREVVDLATNVVGASSLFRSNELERLYRDVRAGSFHPPSSNTAHEVIGKTYLGWFDAPSVPGPERVAAE